MRRASLLYARADARKNGVLIAKYRAALERRGMGASLVITDGLAYEAVFDMVSGAELVINRGRDAELAKFLEDKGVFVSNPSLVNAIANDKYSTYLKLSPLVPMLETHLLKESEPPLPFPFVAKPAAGHGGAGVTMIKSAEELEKYRAEHGEKSVIQPVASEPSRDMRVYVIGGKPVCAMLRESKTDFRSNYSLGGSARLIPAGELPAEALEIVRRVNGALPLHYAGVDIMRDRGRFVLNELEDPVGARMLYINTDIDPAEEHIRFLLKTM
jgi:glutathione synthase/RimK-type ligase-like ATP-grasp enzyme